MSGCGSAFCSFCGRCGRSVKMVVKTEAPKIAPPGVAVPYGTQKEGDDADAKMDERKDISSEQDIPEEPEAERIPTDAVPVEHDDQKHQ